MKKFKKLKFEPFRYNGLNEVSIIFINMDMDIEEILDDQIRFEIATLLNNGTISITRNIEFISKNERDFQRNLRIEEFSAYGNK